MGRVVKFSEIPTSSAGDGAVIGPVTAGDTKEFAAQIIKIAAGKSWTGTAPKAGDCYLYTLDQDGNISANGAKHEFRRQSFATIEQGTTFTIANPGASAALQVLMVTTPLRSPSPHPGFKGGIAIAERAKTEVVPVPDQKKRIYFCGHEHGAHTERGHAMIVVYNTQTSTPLHHHPNAESMFVMLDGACEFTIDGKPVVVKPGEAAYFTMQDVHGLHTAPGHSGASFLEFHIPAAFSTVKM